MYRSINGHSLYYMGVRNMQTHNNIRILIGIGPEKIILCNKCNNYI